MTDQEIPLVKLGQGRDEPCRWADDPIPQVVESPEALRMKRRTFISGVIAALAGISVFAAIYAGAGLANACFFAAFCLGFVLAMVLLASWCE